MSDSMESLRPDDGVERHETALIARMIELSQSDTGVRWVALVVEPNAPEAATLREMKIELLHAPGGSIAAFIPRDSAKAWLGKDSPRLLDWLEDEGTGSRRKLPVIHAARRGMRTATIEYDLPE